MSLSVRCLCQCQCQCHCQCHCSSSLTGTFANRCVDQEDGHVVESGCHVGVVCEGGQEVEVICLIGDGLVFDPESGECKPYVVISETTMHPCTSRQPCTKKTKPETKPYIKKFKH